MNDYAKKQKTSDPYKKAEERAHKMENPCVIVYELENKIKERTAELESAIELLREEIDQRREAEQKWYTLVKHAPDIIFTVDRDNKILFINTVPEGLTPEEAMGTDVLNYVDPEYRDNVSKSIQRVFETGESGYYETCARGPNDTKSWYSTRLGPVRQNNKITAVMLITRDITDRIRVEGELKSAKDKLENWNRELEKRVREKTMELVRSQMRMIQTEKLSAMGKMAGGLAHELNSPLAGLLPMIEKYREEEEDGTERHRELTLMLGACEYMARIVRDFGTFSRDTEGVFHELDLNEVIDDTMSFGSGEMKKKNIRITRDYETGLPMIKGDKTGLQQVVLNMITNACDAMDEHGVFIIRTRCASDRRSVTAEFIDNGGGIRKKNINRIFDPFFTTKEPGRGTGLGLSVSYGIITRHRGTISVESERGKGTKFTVTLPAINDESRI